jgi:hypothetical protein
MATRTVLLAIANLLIPVAILIFATGFFPYKPFMPGLAKYEELGQNDVLGKGWQTPPAAPFDKLVFMVVDALRSDFVFGEESGMSFVQRYVEHSIGERERITELTIIQSDTRRYRRPPHSPRYLSHHHNAPRQSHHHRLDPLLRRRNPQLRRVGHVLHSRDTRHMARANQIQGL